MKTSLFSHLRPALAITLGSLLGLAPVARLAAGTIVFQRGYVDEQYGFGGSLYMVDSASQVETPFFGAGNHPNYAPDGNRITFVDQDGYVSTTAAADYMPQNLVFAGGGSPLGGLKPKWSPDGTLIAFETQITNANKIVITNATCTSGNEYNTDLCNYTKLDETLASVDSDPAWYPIFASSGGTRTGRIIFVRKADANSTQNDIYATDLSFDANGVAHQSGTVNLTQGLSGYEAPSYSHDGTKIVFVQNEALWLMNADGTNQRPIVSSADSGLVYGFDPSFSPDDSKITWGSGFIYTADLVINSNGSVSANNIAGLTNSSSDRSPSWTGTSTTGGGGGGDPVNNSFNVPGTANLWLAGAAAGTTASNGQDTLANAKPYQVQGVNLTAGNLLTFSATGSVSNDPAKPNGTGPDGGVYNGLRFYTHALENHVAPLTASIDSLVGVFLDDSVPAGTTPAGLNFNNGVTGGQSYASISPKLKQPFFIGDGTDDNGRFQTIVVPAGATRLFLGALDPSQNSNNLGSFAVIVNPPAPPDHGGLSATTFTVNGTTTPGSTLASPILSFAAVQTGHPAGLSVFVQVSTTPDDSKSWTDLPDGKNGFMTFDAHGNQYILNTTGYHAQAGQYFRARAVASGYPDSFSNAVGPLDLSTAGAHIPPVVLLVKRNGVLADIDFTAGEISAPSGVALHIQTSATPATEASWTNLADGQSGLMTRSTDTNYPYVFTLLANQLPAGNGVYYRAVATLSGSLPSISNVTGPYVLTADTPPVVTLHPPINQGGKGNILNPYVVTAGQIKFSADAVPVPKRPASKIVSLKLTIDGSVITDASGAPASVDFTYTQLGDHVLQAIATDDLGATSRAGSGVTIIRVVPTAGQAIKAEHTAGSPVTEAVVTGKVFTVAKSGGKWNDANTWKDAGGKPGVPGLKDLAIVGASTLVCDTDIVAGSVSLGGGRLTGGGTFDVFGTITISSGTFDGGTTLYIGTGGVCELINDADVLLKTPTLINLGTINVQGSSSLKGIGQLSNQGTINWHVPIDLPLNAGLDPVAGIRVIDTTSYLGGGNIISTALSGLIGQDGGGLVAVGGGNIINRDGAGLIGQDGGGLIGQDGGGLIGQDGGGLIGQDGGGLIAQGAGNVISTTGGSLHGETSGGFKAGEINESFAETATPTGFTQTGGTVDLNACNIIGPVTFTGGILSGSGRILGNLTNTGGYVAPGHSPGEIAVTGDFTQGAKGTLIVEDGGAFPAQYDQLHVTGAAILGGTLDIRTINGYTPDPADTFSPLAYSSHSGKFATISSNAAVALNASGLLVSANPSLPEPSTGQLLNIATRNSVGAGDNVMIAGFIITGTGSKKVLVRGLGPELTDQGVAGALADPTLELHKPDGSVVSNDNWKDTQQTAIQATGIPPTKNLESAIVATLVPGAYTAILAGKGGATGVGLVEVYDLDQGGASTLANIATRGIVQTDDDVLIGGIIVGGSEPGKILVRAIGPSLTGLGVAGALADPVLELHDGNGNVTTNDNWRETQETAITASTLAPTNDKESAILATLVPGNYTAIVRGAGGKTGVALVEAYALP